MAYVNVMYISIAYDSLTTLMMFQYVDKHKPDARGGCANMWTNTDPIPLSDASVTRTNMFSSGTATNGTGGGV